MLFCANRKETLILPHAYRCLHQVQLEDEYTISAMILEEFYCPPFLETNYPHRNEKNNYKHKFFNTSMDFVSTTFFIKSAFLIFLPKCNTRPYRMIHHLLRNKKLYSEMLSPFLLSIRLLCQRR